MDRELSPQEIRVLGCLIEKKITTPDYYPLTLNAITTACNQKSSRDPVVKFDPADVIRALRGLEELHLVRTAPLSSSSTPRYEHLTEKVLEINPAQLATLAVAMLRGPQTPGEVRSRAGRMYEFSDIEEVELSFLELEERSPPLIVKLPREAGKKEQRHAHLLAGEPKIEHKPVLLVPEAARTMVNETDERLDKLEEQVATLTKQVAELLAAEA